MVPETVRLFLNLGLRETSTFYFFMCHTIYRVDQKITIFVQLIISLNINRFSKIFTVKIKRQFVIKLSLYIEPFLKCVATLPCKISDDPLKRDQR